MAEVMTWKTQVSCSYLYPWEWSIGSQAREGPSLEVNV